MAINHVDSKEQILFGNDNIVVRKYISGLLGGRTLDTTGYNEKYIKAGHVVIKNADGSYSPMPLVTSGGVTSYGSLPSGASYAGVVYKTTLAAKPEVSIITWGILNSELLPYPMASILSAFKTACPHIDFEKDEIDGDVIPTVATPTFSPVAGTYDSTQSVTISCATEGADIYYTLDGSTPTSSSTKYTTAISISATKTVKAIAVKANYLDSAVATAAYTIS
ncbi:MAG: chitobiase/beta-hexosaminidase C-terminal domain-containing protein [Muribaculaceae bacterium]|nr:chitobiase/beta-hexosaminidase C-terminal domain-containing protein [Muribaculaceae bacterium]